MEMEASGSSSSCLQVPYSEGPQGSFSGCLQVPFSDGPQETVFGSHQGLSSDCPQLSSDLPQLISALPQLSSNPELEVEFNRLTLDDPEPESGVSGLVEELWDDFDNDEKEIRELEREIATLEEEERQLDEEMEAFRQSSAAKRAELEQVLKTEQEEYAKLKVNCQNIQKDCEDLKKEDDALDDLDRGFYAHYEKLFELFQINPETKMCAEGKPINVRNPKEGDCDIWNCPFLRKEIPEESILNLTRVFGEQNMNSVIASTLKHSGNETTKSNISTLKHSGNETATSNVSILKHFGTETATSNVSTLKHFENETATSNVSILKHFGLFGNENETATSNASILNNCENEMPQPIVSTTHQHCESETKKQANFSIVESDEDLFKE